MSQVKHLTSSPHRQIGNINMTRGVLAINGAAAATVKTSNAIVYAVNGIFYNKTALAAQALTALSSSDLANYVQPSGLAGFYTQPANTTAYLVLLLDAAGNVRVVQGTYDNQPLLGVAGYGIMGKSIVPDTPDGYVPIGMIKVVTGATTFLPGTDALDKANVTFTFYDLALGPAVSP